jgi:hypothetical protein
VPGTDPFLKRIPVGNKDILGNTFGKGRSESVGVRKMGHQFRIGPEIRLSGKLHIPEYARTGGDGASSKNAAVPEIGYGHENVKA